MNRPEMNALDRYAGSAPTYAEVGATRHGLIPDGSILRLARIVGQGRAKELTLLNDHIGAAEALAMGLGNWVVPAADLESRAARVVAAEVAGFLLECPARRF